MRCVLCPPLAGSAGDERADHVSVPLSVLWPVLLIGLGLVASTILAWTVMLCLLCRGGRGGRGRWGGAMGGWRGKGTPCTEGGYQ